MKRSSPKGSKPDPNPEPLPTPDPKPRPGPGPDPGPIDSDGGVWVRVGTPVIHWRQSGDGGTNIEFNVPMSQSVRITRAADKLNEFQKNKPRK